MKLFHRHKFVGVGSPYRCKGHWVSLRQCACGKRVVEVDGERRSVAEAERLTTHA